MTNLPKVYKIKHHEKTSIDAIALVFSRSLKINKQSLVQNIHWQNQWKNLHLHYQSIIICDLIQNYFRKRKLILNNFYLHKFHGGLHIVGNTFNYYNPRLSKLFKKYKLHRLHLNRLLSTKFGLKKTNLKDKKLFKSQPKLLKEFVYDKQHNDKFKLLAKAIISMSSSPKVNINFTHYYLPKSYHLDSSFGVFSRYNSIRNFWEGLQLLRLIVENKAITHLLAKYVYNSVRRNPKRAAFILYIKRLIDWHFAASKNLIIQGIRIETKGRFNAKSRSKKYILSVGRVAKIEKTSKVDFSFIEAITPFGSLAIKVWVCPYLN